VHHSVVVADGAFPRFADADLVEHLAAYGH
jgi:hypothetical protein